MFLYIQASSSNNKVISFTGRRVGTGIPVYAENRVYSRLLSPTMRQQQWLLQHYTAVISWCVLRLRLWSRAVNIGHGGLSQIIWVCCFREYLPPFPSRRHVRLPSHIISRSINLQLSSKTMYLLFGTRSFDCVIQFPTETRVDATRKMFKPGQWF